ncbi:MAG: hypothetical protein AAF485_04125 [Chloroflexota bacterium]
MSKLKVGYVGVAFATYYAEEHDQFNRAVTGLEALAQQLDFELVPIRYGVMDASQAETVAQELSAQNLDFLLVQAAACADGESIIPLSKVAPRLGIWSIPDPHQDGEIQIHSLVVLNQYASILKRYLRHQKVAFKWFYDHVETERFQKRFCLTIRALKAMKGIANARVGWIGGLSPGFLDMEFDAGKLEQRMGGTRVFTHELAEVVALAKTIDEKAAEAVAMDVTAAGSEVRVTSSQMVKGSRVYLALKELAARNNYSCLAVECWPQFQAQYEVAPCMSYSWLGSEDGMAVSCEGDVMGALSMQLLNELTDVKGSATMLDMTGMDLEANTMLMWHCGVSPRHFANKDGINWINHPTLGRKFPDGPYGVSGDQVFGAQETSLTYIGDSGDTLLVMRSQVVEREKKGFTGTRGWFTEFELNQEPIDIWELMNTLVVRGQEHHYAIGQGDVTNELLEIAAWLNMRTIERVPYRDYLQVEGVNA